MGIGQKIKWCGISMGFAQFFWLAPKVFIFEAKAHQVEIAGDVGGTIHLEPNDTPSAGTPTLTWFALVRQGGVSIPLADCNCQLTLYTQPYSASSTPIQTPPLRPVSEEGYENIPGAEITFPQVGAYTLVITGEPKQPNDFQPFELQFDVTVATGNASQPTQTSNDTSKNNTDTNAGETRSPEQTPLNQNTQPNNTAWAVGIGLISLGTIATLLWLKRRK